MSESKIETVKGFCVVALTKYLMKQLNLTHDKAFEKLMSMEIYPLLMDTETRLFLETNDYLCQCCEIELNNGIEALYSYINEEIVSV